MQYIQFSFYSVSCMLADSRNVQVTRFSSLFLLTSLYYDDKCLVLTTLGTSLIMGTTGTLILVDFESSVYVSSVASTNILMLSFFKR